MQKFKYLAIDVNRKKYRGLFLAENEDDLQQQLARQKLYLVKAVSLSNKSPTSDFFAISSRVKPAEITNFSRQFSIMINSAVPIVKCIETLKEQSYSSLFKKVLNIVYEDILSGVLLSQAFAKHKKVFPTFFVSMISVGEVSGKLDQILNKLASYYENNEKIRNKVRTATAYPTMLFFMIIAVVIILFTFVLPMFKESLEKMGVELPALTRTLFAINDFLQNNGMYLLIVLLCLVALLIMVGASKKGRLFFDKLKMKLPLFSAVSRASIASKFAGGFGILLSSGMSIVDAMELMGKLLGNKYAEQLYDEAVFEVKRGVPISIALEGKNIFPGILIQMISVGESTGAMDEILLRTTGYFDERLAETMQRITSIIEPAMLIFMGVIVCIVVLAVYTPMLSIMESLDGTTTPDIPTP
ncbi:MAG: type II secretion system F family protein [Clostridia bacterium]